MTPPEYEAAYDLYFRAFQSIDPMAISRAVEAHPAVLTPIREAANQLIDLFGQVIEGEVPSGRFVAALDAAHPVLVARGWIATFLHSAASFGLVDVVTRLVELGVDVDHPESPLLPERAITRAAGEGHAAVCRRLIELGAGVNYAWGGDPLYCPPLSYAIEAGSLEVVRLLVEAGGLVNARDRTNRTALDWAVGYKQAAIADYLRSVGGRHARDLPPA